MATCNQVLFSPTGTTRSVLEGIAKGAGGVVGKTVDLTRAAVAVEAFGGEDLVLIGMPVYSGRLPAVAAERFAGVKGGGARAVAVVVYGNRAYDDALLELCDLCTKQGFRVVGAAGFIGEHSFSSDETPIALNRPDAADLRKAETFGRCVAGATEVLDLSTIPGNRPYKDLPVLPGAAADSSAETCSRCGQCVEVCPTGAVCMEEAVPVTDPDQCIWCEACVRACPGPARSVTLPKVQEIAVRLHGMCAERREPDCYCAG